MNMATVGAPPPDSPASSLLGLPRAPRAVHAPGAALKLDPPACLPACRSPQATARTRAPPRGRAGPTGSARSEAGEGCAAARGRKGGQGCAQVVQSLIPCGRIREEQWLGQEAAAPRSSEALLPRRRQRFLEPHFLRTEVVLAIPADEGMRRSRGGGDAAGTRRTARPRPRSCGLVSGSPPRSQLWLTGSDGTKTTAPPVPALRRLAL